MKVVQSIHIILFFILIFSGCQKPDTNSNSQAKLRIGGKIFNALDSSGIANRKITVTDQFSCTGFNGASTCGGASTTAITDLNGNYSSEIVVDQKHVGFNLIIDNHDSLFTDQFLSEIPCTYYLNYSGTSINNNQLNLYVYPRAFINVTFKNLAPIKLGDYIDVSRTTELMPTVHAGSWYDSQANLGRTVLTIKTFTIASVKTFLRIAWDQYIPNQHPIPVNDTLVLNPFEVKEIIVQ